MTERALPVTILEPAGIDPDLLDHSLSLRFDLGQFDPRITFTRNSSATYFGSDGLLKTAAANVPRIDYDPVTGERKGFLVEESRTNLLTYSEQFDNAAWTKERLTVTTNAVVAPDGTLTADKLVEDTTTNSHRVVQVVSGLTSSATYTVSFYAKKAEKQTVYIQDGGGAGTNSASSFNLESGTASKTANSSHVSAQMTLVGNGWYRCVLVYTVPAGVTTISWIFGILGPAFGPSYTGDGYSGVYIWGAQLEAGAFATSYIKTEASQVTRAADNAAMTGTNFSSWYRADEGTLFVESNRLATLPANTPLVILNGPNTNLIRIRADGLGYYVDTYYNSSIQFAAGLGTTNRFCAVAYQLNNSVGASAGVLGSVDTSCLVPLGVSNMSIGFHSYNQNRYSGHIRNITYYPKRLTNDQLVALTQ